MNSTRHGLLGQFHLIPGENPEEFSEFAEGIRTDLKPEGLVEESLVDRIIKDTWRLNRFDNVESGVLANKESLDDLSLDDLWKGIKLLNDQFLQAYDRIAEIDKYLHDREASDDRNTQATAQNKSGAGSTWNTKSPRFVEFLTAGLELAGANVVLGKNLDDRLRRANLGNRPAETEGERDAPSTEEAANTMARAFSSKRAAVGLFLRYRTTVERSRVNGLHELQRFQAARQGQIVPPPEVLDVNVNFTGKDQKEKY